MLLSRFWRSRFTRLFKRLIIFTTVVYALLNVLIDMSSCQQQQQQPPRDGSQPTIITITKPIEVPCDRSLPRQMMMLERLALKRTLQTITTAKQTLTLYGLVQ